MGLEIAQMWDAADGKLVDMSSDTLPGLPTQEQILELRAKGDAADAAGRLRLSPRSRRRDGRERTGRQRERFNHVHMYHEHPLCAVRWYVEHLGAQLPQGRGGAPPARRRRGDASSPTLRRPGPRFQVPGFVREPSGGVNFDDISILIRPWPGGGLVSTRGTSSTTGP